ncbi:MAG: MFS transporter [Cyanobacteriota bacterium]|nr:MFS transporter [Cyanobacteriota bacterium]
MLKLITLLLTSTMTVMAGATIAPALPQIQQFFADAPRGEFLVKLMLTLPGLFTAIAGPFVGIIIDRFGRKKLLAASVALYGLAGGSGFVLNSLTGLLIARAILGLSVAGIMTASVTLIADYYQGEKRNRVMGVQAAFMGFGGVVFLVFGGFLADISWRFPFLIYLSALAIFPLVVFVLTEPNRARVALDKTGKKVGEKIAEMGGNLRSDVASATLRDRYQKIRLVFIYAVMFLTAVCFYMVPVQLPFYLTENYDVSNSQTGIAIACSTLSSAIISMNYGFIKSKLSFMGVVVLLYSLMGFGYGIISLATSYPIVILGLILSGMGLGLLMPNLNVWLNAKTPIAMRGKALGGLTTCMFLGQFCSPIFTGPIAARIGIGNAYGLVGFGMLILAAILAGISGTGRYSLKV